MTAGADPDQDRPTGDPWQAFGYLVSGVLLYGALGWLGDRWWGTSFLLPIGIVVGVGLGMYLTFTRFGVGRGGDQDGSTRGRTP